MSDQLGAIQRHNDRVIIGFGLVVLTLLAIVFYQTWLLYQVSQANQAREEHTQAAFLCFNANGHVLGDGSDPEDWAWCERAAVTTSFQPNKEVTPNV